MRTFVNPHACLALMITAAACAPPGDAEEGQDDGNDTQVATGGDARCVSGQSIACECEDSRPGAQVCMADGSGFEACVCDGSVSGSAGDTANDSPGSSTSGNAGDDPGDDSDSTGSGVPANPSWSKDIVPIFNQSCGSGNTSCHTREAYGAAVDSDCRGWLALENVPLGSEFYAGPTMGQPTGCPDIPLYDRLMMAPWQCGPDSAYIVPGDPQASYVLQKIYGQQVCGSPGEFDPMPPPGAAFNISDEQIELLENWIVSGAPFDG